MFEATAAITWYGTEAIASVSCMFLYAQSISSTMFALVESLLRQADVL
jgi:hypothetical protein